LHVVAIALRLLGLLGFFAAILPRFVLHVVAIALRLLGLLGLVAGTWITGFTNSTTFHGEYPVRGYGVPSIQVYTNA
jgi:hypothetical protein